MAVRKCKHCDDIVASWLCDRCGKQRIDQCKACHEELAHGVIKNQNIHVVGSHSAGSANDDPDAFARADN